MKAKMWSHNCWIEETNPTKLNDIFEKLLIKSGFQIVFFNEYTFHPQGYSCFWLLKESHLAIHTFPEEDKSYVEISSCVLTYYQKFVKMLSKL